MPVIEVQGPLLGAILEIQMLLPEVVTDLEFLVEDQLWVVWLPSEDELRVV